MENLKLIAGALTGAWEPKHMKLKNNTYEDLTLKCSMISLFGIILWKVFKIKC